MGLDVDAREGHEVQALSSIDLSKVHIDMSSSHISENTPGENPRSLHDRAPVAELLLRATATACSRARTTTSGCAAISNPPSRSTEASHRPHVERF